jgi:hypothetical protein
MLLPDHRLDIPGPLHWDPDLLRYLGNPGRFEVVHTHRKMLNFSAFKISVPEAQRDRCLNAMHP